MQEMKIDIRRKSSQTVAKSEKTRFTHRKQTENGKDARNITTLGLLKTVPKGVDRRNIKKYEFVLNWLCKPHERKEQTYAELARRLDVTERTLFNWLDLPETNAYVNEYLRKLYMREKAELYEHHKKLAKKDRAWAKWVAEYYEGFLGNAPATAPVTVVFNFPAGSARPEQAEVEIVQESGDDD